MLEGLRHHKGSRHCRHHKIPARSLSQSGEIRPDPCDSVKPHDIVLDDELATKELKDVAREIMTWCFSRWGGPFGARAGTDSMGIKLGIWNDRFENVRCAVMLLALRQVNAATKLKDHNSRTGSGDTGKMLRDTSLSPQNMPCNQLIVSCHLICISLG